MALDAVLTRLYSGTAYSGGSAWFAYCHAGVTLIDTTYYKLDGISPPQVISHNVVGTLGTTTMPSEVAYVITNRTAFRGRDRRGRVYLPAPVTAQITTGGVLLPGTATAMIAQLAGIKTALGGPGAAPFWELGVASYITQHTVNGVPTGAALTPAFYPNDTFSMDTKADVQRRRK